MENSGANAYVYAKASGMLSRSFTGERAAALFACRTLSELWGSLFQSQVPVLPEAILAKRIEEAAFEKMIFEYKRLLSAFDRPQKVLVLLLQYFDYFNLKTIGAAAAAGKKEMPHLRRVFPYNILNYDAWPDIAKITKKSCLFWYDRAPEFSEQQYLDSRIDSQFVLDLWNAAENLPKGERDAVEELILKKYSVRNMIWALRLKFFYKMSGEEIVRHISFLGKAKNHSDALARDALDILEKNPEHYEDWASWKYARFLNPHEEGSLWTIDPNWVEAAAEKELSHFAKKKFHAFPFTSVVLVCWFFLKLNELDCVRAAVEALRLNIETQEAMDAAGIK